MAVTIDDLIVLAPWIVVGATVGVICARLFLGRSRARRRGTPQSPERPASTGESPGRRLRGHNQGNGAQDEIPGPGCTEAAS